MEVKIQIPDNCELVKEGNSYIIKEKDSRPKTWEEFCERYPVKAGESYLMAGIDGVFTAKKNYSGKRSSRVLCYSKEEAEAFLALMQLRQLRKAWVGDWEQPTSAVPTTAILHDINKNKVVAETSCYWAGLTLSFPTKKMAEDFLSCFKDLCETAKILL